MSKSVDLPEEFGSFRDWLMSLDNAALEELFELRPDVLHPPPPSFGVLAARLQLWQSLALALSQLNAVDLLVLEAAADLGGELTPVDAPAVVSWVLECVNGSRFEPPQDKDLNEAIRKLRALALIFGSKKRFRVVSEVMATLPIDWQLLPEPGVPSPSYSEAQEFIEHADSRCRKILETLLDSGGSGITKDADEDADPQRPIPILLAAGLLLRVDSRTVRLAPVTRRVLWDLGPLDIPFVPPFPDISSDDQQFDQADRGATAAGLEVVRHMGELISVLGDSPVACLRDGSIGVRSVQRLSKELDISQFEVCRLVCLGVTAGLLDTGIPELATEGTELKPVLAPTVDADAWLATDLHVRWAMLIQAWSGSYFGAWCVVRPVNLLHVNTFLPALRKTKQLLLSQFVRAGKMSLDQALSMAGFYAPLDASNMQYPKEVLDEAVWLGVLDADFSPTHMAKALIEDPAQLEKATALATPATVDYFIAQGDMTILVPGPLEPVIQRKLELLADLESPGLASVYRISEGSLQRALDAGLGAEDIASFLRDYIKGEVPQAISYLLADLGRQHGDLRGGKALSYVRCQDTDLLEHAVSVTPELRLIAPTVAISHLSLGSILESLQRGGFRPVAEDAHGFTIDMRPSPTRLISGTTVQLAPELPKIDAAEVIAELRQNTNKATTENSSPNILSTLQAAVRSKRRVTLGFVDKHGVASVRVVQPMSVTGGQLDALEPLTGAIHRYQLHRITSVIVDN